MGGGWGGVEGSAAPAAAPHHLVDGPSAAHVDEARPPHTNPSHLLPPAPLFLCRRRLRVCAPPPRPAPPSPFPISQARLAEAAERERRLEARTEALELQLSTLGASRPRAHSQHGACAAATVPADALYKYFQPSGLHSGNAVEPQPQPRQLFTSRDEGHAADPPPGPSWSRRGGGAPGQPGSSSAGGGAPELWGGDAAPRFQDRGPAVATSIHGGRYADPSLAVTVAERRDAFMHSKRHLVARISESVEARAVKT